MKGNFWTLIAVLALALVAQAVGESESVVFKELDVTLDVDYWNTTGHENPIVSRSTASLEDVPLALTDDSESDDYLAEHAFDTRQSYDPVPSDPIEFTSEPLGFSVIVR